MGFEINSQVIIFYNLINRETRRFYISKVVQQCCGEETVAAEKQNFKLNLWWVTGFVDGEGSFMVNIYKNMERKVGWTVKPEFSITQH